MLMWRLMIPKRRHLIMLAVLSIALFAFLYFDAKSSDPYAAAEHFISTDSRVSEVVGSVSQTKFKYWEGFQIVSAANGGTANFTFEVVGSKSTSLVEVHLRSSSGVWQVVTADVRTPDGAASRIVGTTASLSACAAG
jgi:Cytochrome oxidase complex assembly protein 1